MKKNGFTLAELLGVVIILGLIIMVIASPLIGQLNKNKMKLDEVALTLLNSSAETYMNQNGANYKEINNTVYYIPVGLMVDKGILKEKFVDSYNSETLSRDSVIKATVKNASYDFELIANPNSLNKVAQALNTTTYKYLGGTYNKSNSSNNYVQFNGIMFRILGVNNDGTIRLFSDEDLTVLYDSGTYKNGYIRKWLNEEFYSKIDYNDLIISQNYCMSNVATPTNDCSDGELLNDNVALISHYELNQIKANTSYFNNYFTLMSMSGGKIYRSTEYAELELVDMGILHSIRPLISMQQNTTITSGSGTFTDPYILARDLKENTNVKLEDNNNLAGEYINLDNRIYRIVETKNNTIKIVLNDIYRNAANNPVAVQYGPNNFNLTNGVGKVLNSDLYDLNALSKIIRIGSIYAGDPYLDKTNTPINYDFKQTALRNTNHATNAGISLPRARSEARLVGKECRLYCIFRESP